MLKKEENSPEFNFLAERLRNIDLSFFMERSKDFKQGFIFSVTLGYNYDASLGNSVDIGKKNKSSEDTRMQNWQNQRTDSPNLYTNAWSRL